jgi:Domain of unknown function (DUF4386)
MCTELSPLVLARIAGVLGLIGIAFGAFDIGHIRSALIVAGNPALTVQNILAHETLFRVGFTGHLLELVCNVLAEIIGFYLFWRINVVVAAIALFCGFLGIAVESLDMLNSYVPLKLAAEAGAMGTFSPEQLHSLSYFYVQLQDTGLLISFLFYGMDELLTGYLVFRSHFLPRVLGVLGGIAGFCYIAHTLLYFAAPSLDARLFPYVLYACFPGEALNSLWLATIGLNVVKWNAWRHEIRRA